MVAKNGIKLINSRLLNDWVGNGGIQKLPKENTKEVYYTCTYNTEKNLIPTSIFSNCVNNTH